MDNETLLFFQTDEFRAFFYSGDLLLMKFLILLMLTDILTGIAKALKNKRLWSRKGLFGYGRKMLIFLIIILSNVIDQVMSMDGYILKMTMIFYICNEGLSILENCAALNAPVPSFLTERLAVIKKQEDNRPSITTEIKEEMTTKYSKELDDDETSEINIKVKK